MKPHLLLLKPVLVALLGAGMSSACLAETCEVLKDQIDAKIRAGGVSSFSLRIVDAAEPASGRTVGTCGMGQKKIVYTVAAAGSAAPARASERQLPSLMRGKAPVSRWLT